MALLPLQAGPGGATTLLKHTKLAHGRPKWGIASVRCSTHRRCGYLPLRAGPGAVGALLLWSDVTSDAAYPSVNGSLIPIGLT